MVGVISTPDDATMDRTKVSIPHDSTMVINDDGAVHTTASETASNRRYGSTIEE